MLVIKVITIGCKMLNQDIQNALSTLDNRSKKKTKNKMVFSILLGVGLFAAVLTAGWRYYEDPMPTVSVDHLSRLIIIASRTSDNDPIRLLGDIERHMGKKMQDLSSSERANALSYLMGHIELHYNQKDLISY